MKLFKYFHPDRTDILINGNIRYSSSASLNDPFEFKPHISAIGPNLSIDSNLDLNSSNILIKKYAEKMLELRNHIEIKVLNKEISKVQSSMLYEYLKFSNGRLLSAIQTSMEATFDEMIGVLCLTESPDNLLMWAHYAQEHQGFVIDFDAMHSYFNNDSSRFKKVTYVEGRINTTLSDFNDIDPFFTKGKEWSYETEWRLIDYLKNATTILDEGANAIHLFKFPKSIISRVILGCKMFESIKLEIQQILSNTEEYKSVICMQAQMDKSKYALTFS